MSDTSARLALPYLAAGQMQKHVTLNEALTRLDGLVQCCVTSRSLAAQPAEAESGALYILPMGAEGADWSLHPAGSLVRGEGGGWTRLVAPPGLIAVVKDANEVLVWHEADWIPLAAFLGELQNVARLGIGATADAANPFLARLNSALWTARETGDGGTGDLRLVLNKAGPSGVLSLILQSAWSGRAELGLIGEDAFGLKVSVDGADWTEAMKVDPASGRVSFPLGATRRELTVVTGDGGWSVPDWARWVEVTAVGAGGGGGGGAWGATATVRGGGGGGAAGSVSRALWPVESLTADLTLEIGAGGAGGAADADGGDGHASRVRVGLDQLLSAEGGLGGRSGSDGGSGGLPGAGELTGNPGGAGGASADAGAGPAVSGLTSGGGGGGGGLSAADDLSAAAPGGQGGRCARPAGGGDAGTAAAGGAGNAASAILMGPSGGGGGGGSASLTSGYAGGTGGLYGAGGGGGGAGVTAGGAGGAGAHGLILLVAVG